MCESEHPGHFLTSSFGSPIKAERVVQEKAANNNEVFTNTKLLSKLRLPGKWWDLFKKVNKFNT